MSFLLAHFCSLLKFLWIAAQLSCVSDTSPQFCIICRVIKVIPCASILVIKEEVKQYCLYKVRGTPLVAGFQLRCFCWSQLFETGCSATPHCSFISYILLQFVCENVIRDSVKSITKIKKNNTCPSQLIHWASYRIIKSCRVGQVWFPLHSSILTTLSPLLLQMFWNSF